MNRLKIITLLTAADYLNTIPAQRFTHFMRRKSFRGYGIRPLVDAIEEPPRDLCSRSPYGAKQREQKRRRKSR